MPLTRLSGAEFEALMAPLGPFGSRRDLVVGVSGGPDSMALALLLRDWGAPLAIVIDHGLRAESRAEAATTLSRLAALRIPARSIRLDLATGPDLGARARTARYDALFGACRDTGCPDLVVGHHARDQDETVLLRRRAGSGPAGLAGMAALAWRNEARLLRPLLGTDPVRLRRLLAQAGVSWVDDPGNTDPATARGALRAGPVARAEALGGARRQHESKLAEELSRAVTLHPGGFAEVEGALSVPAWSALVWTVSGRPYPPAPSCLGRLAAGGTVHGVQVWRGLVMREPTAAAPAIPAIAGAVWDGRFVLRGTVPGATLGALGDDARVMRCRSAWPSAVLRGLPAVRVHGNLLAVPHLTYPDAQTCRTVPLEFRPVRPLAGAPFWP